LALSLTAQNSRKVDRKDSGEKKRTADVLEAVGETSQDKEAICLKTGQKIGVNKRAAQN